MENKFKAGEYKTFTKFEQSQLKKELTRLQRFFEGIREIKSSPDVVFVVDPIKEKVAVTEINSALIPLVALADTNADPDSVDLLIPANDDSVKSISFIVEEIAKAYQLGKQER